MAESPTSITRRTMLQRGALAAAGLPFIPSFGRMLWGAMQGGRPDGDARAKAVIQIWLWGGACHIDTFDPKPGAGCRPPTARLPQAGSVTPRSGAARIVGLIESEDENE